MLAINDLSVELAMEYNTSELCDLYADMVDVVEPIFANYGGRRSFGGMIHTVKCLKTMGWFVKCYRSLDKAKFC